MTESMSDEALHTRLAEITERSLSRTSRYGHLVMTTVAVIMAAMLGYLLWGLHWGGMTAYMPVPVRTIALLWFVFAVTCAWVVFGVVVLSRRRPMLPYDELKAAVVALILSQVFTGSFLGIWAAHHDYPRHTMSMPPLAWLGIAMSVVAFVVAVRALMRLSRLRSLRERLERELADG
jgi:hypothetical protein